MFRNTSSSVWALLVVAVALGSSARAAEPIPARVWADLAGDPATRARAVAALEAAGPQAVAFLRERLKPVAADARRIDALIEQLDSPQFVRRQQATEELEYLGKIAQPQLEKALASKPPLEVRRRVEQLLKRLQPQVVPRSEKEMLRAAFPKRPERSELDRMRERAAVAAARGYKILFRTPGGDLTPRQFLALYGKDGQVSPLPLAAPELAKGPREAAPAVSPSWVRASAAIRVLESVGNNEARELLRRVAGGAEDALPTVEARSALKRLKAKAKP
jgi:hypothetical protein